MLTVRATLDCGFSYALMLGPDDPDDGDDNRLPRLASDSDDRWMIDSRDASDSSFEWSLGLVLIIVRVGMSKDLKI